MTRRACSIEGCAKPVHGHGWCQMHWARWKRNGDPGVSQEPRMVGAPLAERFWAKVARRGSDECWEWLAARGSGGYGTLYVEGSTKRAHRVAYELVRGAIPDGLVIDHLCRNTACVNPWHLEPVTYQVNSARGINAQKTACKHGHPYTPDNTAFDRNGGRLCRTCRRIRDRARSAA